MGHHIRDGCDKVSTHLQLLEFLADIRIRVVPTLSNVAVICMVGVDHWRLQGRH
jgi:hypothetical protein